MDRAQLRRRMTALGATVRFSRLGICTIERTYRPSDDVLGSLRLEREIREVEPSLATIKVRRIDTDRTERPLRTAVVRFALPNWAGLPPARPGGPRGSRSTSKGVA